VGLVLWLLGRLPGPVLTLEPSAIDFGNQPVQTSETRSITVTNQGSAPLIIRGVDLNGISPSDYAVEDEDCTGSPLPPGAHCLIKLTFTPSTMGPVRADLQIASNSARKSPAVTIIGMGTPDGITYSPQSLTFDELEMGGGSQTKKITFQ